MVQVLSNIPVFSHPWVDGRPGPLDDAAVVRPEGATRSMVLTIDVITPIVDDPRVFGAIAAANAMSDVYAMGGKPEVALSFIGLPTDKLPLSVLREIALGIQETAARGRCAVVGGHTIGDTEPKAGLAVVGSVDPSRVWSHRSAEAGQALILTKALGTGIMGQAVRAGRAPEALVREAVDQMIMLNDVAAEVGLALGATSCTDVTGFGLLGHLRNILETSALSADLSASSVPLLDGVLALVEEGLVPGGSKRNLAHAAQVTSFADTVSPALQTLLADAQTSGGLLLCLPEAHAALAVEELQRGGALRAARIGALRAADPNEGVRIRVS